jgi:DNA mismatch repair protein MSH6
MSNNLFNYFKKVDSNSKNNTPLKPNESIKNEVKASPQSAVKKSNQESSSVKKKLSVAETKREKSVITLDDKENDNKMETDLYDNENDDDEIIRPISKVKRSLEPKDSPRTKRRRLVIQSDDDDDSSDVENKKSKSKSKKTSDDEYKMDEDEDVEEEDDDVIDDDDDFIDDGSYEEEKKPKKPKKTIISKKGLNKSQSTASPKGSKATNSPAPKAAALDSFAANSNEDSNGPVDITKYKHMNYEFLKDEKIKDINGNKKGDPDYDPRTLYVPPEFKKQCTPALRQWWELKSTNFDVLFFFKVGKFYELYHQDAVIAVKELGLSFMRGIL